ncbi:carbohydrate ABC transporter permease [Deinococcus multiflagellatus]|uniref:Carbohydrate ABC transporter permease n=1 Tax=Deinococcus multiflagellatus TaxID=1656887 RepID=A0ABW1ZF51_9DEIO|nr:sugar ABC transporter permease [Deinococcus multiflagellatus]MBZ9712065.1 sugar ABC transporter permease [Deinococcus multiflagellatus]
MKPPRAVPWLFLSPFLVLFAAFYVAPVLYAGYLSLFIKKRAGFGPAKEVFGGLTNYVRAFQDSDFLASLLNILKFAAVQIPLMIVLATALALALDASRGRLQGFFRTAFYLPYTIPSVIAGLLWGYLYSKNLSPFNQITGRSFDFLGSDVVLWSIANIVTWTWTGYNMITLYAALQNIPSDLYEAARIDGADGWNLTRFIKLPLLKPSLLLVLIFSIIGTMQIFSEPFVIRPLGYVPDNITPNTYLYLVATRDGNFSYAATLAILLALFTLLLSAVFLRFTRRGGDL